MVPQANLKFFHICWQKRSRSPNTAGIPPDGQPTCNSKSELAIWKLRASLQSNEELDEIQNEVCEFIEICQL